MRFPRLTEEMKPGTAASCLTSDKRQVEKRKASCSTALKRITQLKIVNSESGRGSQFLPLHLDQSLWHPWILDGRQGYLHKRRETTRVISDLALFALRLDFMASIRLMGRLMSFQDSCLICFPLLAEQVIQVGSSRCGVQISCRSSGLNSSQSRSE